MSMGVGLTVVVALFIDAGTVTADFNRRARTPRDSLISTFSAFPFANIVAMLVGGIMTAALAVPNANPFGLGVIGIVVAAGNIWAFFIQWLSLLGVLVPRSARSSWSTSMSCVRAPKLPLTTGRWHSLPGRSVRPWHW
jgi:purine-cytosine permease-like protein